MTARLRPLSALFLASLLCACASTPSNQLGELPRTPTASIEQLLEQAAAASGEEAGEGGDTDVAQRGGRFDVGGHAGGVEEVGALQGFDVLAQLGADQDARVACGRA